MLPFSRLPKWMRGALLAIALCLGMGLVGVTAALAQDAPTFVVALDKLDDNKLYARTVMFAAPLENGGHFGLILNRPTQHTMAQAFPDHGPSAAVKDNIYLGGPAYSKIIFALARAAESPGAGSREVVPGVWLMTQSGAIDAFIERSPNEARYFIGLVRWKPGELREEIRGGAVALRPFDAARLFSPDTSSMYEELVPPGRKPIAES